MGNILSINIEGTEQNYNAKLESYQLTHSDKLDLDYLFNAIRDHNGIRKIGSFYNSINNSKDLEILWHSFCYKHKLVINKIRFESYQILYDNKFNVKHEIGFNALWNIQNNEKIPIQCFKKEKCSNLRALTSSSWYIYIGLKTLKQRISDIMSHVNIKYNFHDDTHSMAIDNEIMDVLCSYLPSNHILNYNGRRTFKLCKFTLNHEEEDEVILNEINNLVQTPSDFMKLFEINTIKLLMFDYNVKSHEIFQFIKYLILFFHHFYVNKWIKSKCNYHSKQNKIINNALNEVMNIWSRQQLNQRNNCKQGLNMNHIRVK